MVQSVFSVSRLPGWSHAVGLYEEANVSSGNVGSKLRVTSVHGCSGRLTQNLLIRAMVVLRAGRVYYVYPHMSCGCCIDSWCADGYHEV